MSDSLYVYQIPSIFYIYSDVLASGRTRHIRFLGSADLLTGSLAIFCRSHIVNSGGLDVYLHIIVRKQCSVSAIESPQKEALKIIKEASAGLLALLEDDQTKLEVQRLRMYHYRTKKTSDISPCPVYIINRRQWLLLKALAFAFRIYAGALV